jgi:hypothetical protein
MEDTFVALFGRLILESDPLVANQSDLVTNILAKKIYDNFSPEQRLLFLGMDFMFKFSEVKLFKYLNYKTKNNFEINIEDTWKLCGFARQDIAINIIKTRFTENVDYALEECTQTSGKVKLRFLMNIKTFKWLCIIAKTKESNEISDGFYKIEEWLHEALDEERKISIEYIEKLRKTHKGHPVADPISTTKQI